MVCSQSVGCARPEEVGVAAENGNGEECGGEGGTGWTEGMVQGTARLNGTLFERFCWVQVTLWGSCAGPLGKGLGRWSVMEGKSIAMD